MSMIYKACSSFKRPSRKKWFFRNAMSGLVLSVFEKNWSLVGMVIAGACTCTHRIRKSY